MVRCDNEQAIAINRPFIRSNYIQSGEVGPNAGFDRRLPVQAARKLRIDKPLPARALTSGRVSIRLEVPSVAGGFPKG